METALIRTIITDRRVDTRIKLGGVCLCCNQVDNTTGGVTTVQCPLRTSQHLDSLHIEELSLKDSSRYLIDAVDVNTHARVTKGTNRA